MAVICRVRLRRRRMRTHTQAHRHTSIHAHAHTQTNIRTQTRTHTHTRTQLAAPPPPHKQAMVHSRPGKRRTMSHAPTCERSPRVSTLHKLHIPKCNSMRAYAYATGVFTPPGAASRAAHSKSACGASRSIDWAAASGLPHRQTVALNDFPDSRSFCRL